MLGDADALRVRLEDATAAGVPESDLRETLLMVIPYAGYPRGLGALAALFAATGGDGTERTGSAARSTGDGASSRDPDVLRALGLRTFRSVWGERAEAILSRIGSWHAELPDWLLAEAYGRILSRPGLPLADREVLAAAFLTALDQPDQLQGHLRGGLRAGASPERLRAAVEAAARRVSPAAAARARERLRLETGLPPDASGS